MARITLLTDFGTGDGFVGAMKGVLATRAPESIIDDISHAVPPGDIRKASRILGRYWSRFPSGTVHLVVVDPGVGTARRGMAVEADGRFCVGPDNGVFTKVFESAVTWRCVELQASEVLPDPESSTFHGRDWFAPAAAYLATGLPLEVLGTPLSDPVRLPLMGWEREGDRVKGVVVEVDRFGNLLTNLPGRFLSGSTGVFLGGERVPTGRTYGEVDPGHTLALVNSDGFLEIAVRNGSAAESLGVGVGGVVEIVEG